MLETTEDDSGLLELCKNFMESDQGLPSAMWKLKYELERALFLADEVMHVFRWYVIFSFIERLSDSMKLQYWQSRLPFLPRKRFHGELQFYDKQATLSQKFWILECCAYLYEKISHPRFFVGQTVYIESRHEGVVKRKIKGIIKDDDEYCYELNESVIFHKDGLKVGAHYPMYDRRDDRLLDCPCPEDWLMLPGDFFFSTHPIVGGRSDTLFFPTKNPQ
jgi:hypothetical protein